MRTLPFAVFVFALHVAAAPTLAADSDGDGVPDEIDNAPFFPNPDQADSDGDGIADVVDNAPFVPNPDQFDGDGDGVGDAGDNAPSVPNPDQSDGDDDGVGDVADNAESVWNPQQEDQDFDGLGDVMDPTPLGGDNTDSDADGIADVLDPQPAEPNLSVAIAIDAGGPYTIPVGGDLMLDFSGTTSAILDALDNLTPVESALSMAWFFDFDNDSIFADATQVYYGSGPTVLLTWAEMQALGIGSVGSHPLSARASYNAFLATDTESFTVTIVPEPSSLVLAGMALIGLLLWDRRRRTALGKLLGDQIASRIAT